jgi:hypothetical protein
MYRIYGAKNKNSPHYHFNYKLLPFDPSLLCFYTNIKLILAFHGRIHSRPYQGIQFFLHIFYPIQSGMLTAYAMGTRSNFPSDTAVRISHLSLVPFYRQGCKCMGFSSQFLISLHSMVPTYRSKFIFFMFTVQDIWSYRVAVETFSSVTPVWSSKISAFPFLLRILFHIFRILQKLYYTYFTM